jgi:WD40 repeat protein
MTRSPFLLAMLSDPTLVDCADFHKMEIDCEQDNYVRHCRFHPLEPKLACALQNGKVCVFVTESPASLLMNWRKVHLQAVTNAHVSKIDWNVRVNELFFLFCALIISFHFLKFKIDGTQLAAGCEDGTMILWKENDEMLEDGNDEPSVWNYGHVKSLEVRKHGRSATCVHWNKENNGGYLLATGDLTGVRK